MFIFKFMCKINIFVERNVPLLNDAVCRTGRMDWTVVSVVTAVMRMGVTPQPDIAAVWPAGQVNKT